MSLTKRQVVEAGLEEIGIASFEFDIQPEELQSGLRRLNAMMAEWNARGIRLGYPLVADPANDDVDQDTGVPDSAYEAMITNLAIKLAPAYGRQASRETKVTAKKSLNTLMMRSGVINPVEKQYPSTLPLGQGNQSYRYQRTNYFPTPTDPLEAGPDSVLEL